MPGWGFAQPFPQQLDADQYDRHEHDGRDAVRHSQVAPFHPVVSAIAIGDGKGGAPEGDAERNQDYRVHHEDDGFTKTDEMEGRLDEHADAGGRQDDARGIEGLALQGVERRPACLLRGDEVSASRGQYVCPPMPGRHEQQHGDENRVRRKEQRDLAVGEAQQPGQSRRQVIAGRTRQHLSQRAEVSPVGAKAGAAANIFSFLPLNAPPGPSAIRPPNSRSRTYHFGAIGGY